KRLYFLQQMDLESTAYNIPSALILEGILEKAKLEDAFKKLIYRHESLRTFFEMIDDEPIQGVRDVVDFEIEYYDLKEVKVEVEEKHLEGTRGLAPLPTKNFIRPFDLSQTPLFRVGLTEVEEEKHLLMVDMHHIISDGMSGGILVRDFVGLYSGNTLPAMRFQYKDYAQWQNQEKESIRVQDQARYWQKQFEEEIPVLDLPTDDVRPGVQRFEGSRLSFEISSETTDALKALALEEGATLYMVLLAIYTIFLAKISNQEDIIIGAPVAGRRHADLEKIIGMFVNTLAMRHYPTGEKTFIRFLAEVKERTLKAFENQEYQYEDLVEQVVVNRDVSRNPLFDASFLLQNIEVPQLAIPGLKFIPYEYETVTSKFDLTLNGIEVEEKLLLSFEYSTNLFKKATIERFATYLKKIVSSVVDNAEVKICDLEILVQEEKKKLLYDFNNTTAEYPEDKTIHELFAEQVERTPDNIAVMGPVVIKDRTYMTYMTYISYRELNEKSNQLASRLRSKAVVPESIVAIMVERSIEMIVGILGILKAGGAYLPIDPDSPEERIKFMLADSNAKILLTSREIPNLSSPEAYNNSLKGTPSHLQPTPVTAVSSSSTLTSTLTCQVSPANLAYVIYTSGSTGRPKGVMIRHKSVVNFIKGMTDIIDFTRNSTILSLTTISFDIFVLETLLPLSTGSKVVVGTNDQQRNPEAAAKILGNQLVTILQVTPSRLTLLISADQSAAALKPLKYLLVGGEAFPEQLLEKAREITTGEIYNLYGPTETTIWSTVKNVSIGKSLNIGKPIINTRIYILGKNSTLQPIGIVGDLYIGGDGLARGYVNNPGLTAEKFDHDLWDFQDDQDKKKKIPGKNHMQSCNHASMQYHSPTPQYPIYQTSDLARWLWDGNIEFLGRIDHQVKIRGNRIELGEIECQLLQHPEVKEAVVLAKEDEIGDSDRYLAAYIVSECDVSVLVSQLREYLSKVLPGYMMPSYFVQIDKIPLTPSGKIHRRALPAPEAKTYGEYIAPGDEIEEVLSEIWSLVLGTKKELIGIEDNFFHLGGHSLKATTLVLKIHKVFNVKLPLVEIFKRPTIRGLSQYIRHAVKEKYTPIEVTEQKEYYPLSSAQKRLYILQQMELGGTAYNMPEFIPLQMDSHLTKIEETFKKLINRHENFRTSYYMVKDEPVQRIHEEVEFQLEYYDASPGEVVDIGKKFVRAFDLSQAPLLRVGLAAHQGESSGNSYILLVDMHHIISDGVSHQILVKDFITSYREEE
ncbi:amino acid adenylation domain-containing protein, partial [Acidobacteriota bacterium]